MISPAAPSGVLSTPRLARRLACFLYEGVLLFGVVMAAGLVYGIATQQRHALIGASGLRATVFAVLALYFVYFWSKSGQTLAMQTWHMRLVTQDGQALTPLRSLCRYLLAWMWVMPALLTVRLSGLQGTAPALAVLLAGVLGYAALVWLHKDRQYWHDVICKTRVVTWLPARKTAP